jgi:hypothetical protein
MRSNLKYAIAFAAFLVASPAIADDTLLSSDGMLWTATGDAIFKTPQQIAILGPGGCIRGPFKVIGENHVMFEIFAGDYYPAGCAK